jgi:hypothetical protein
MFANSNGHECNKSLQKERRLDISWERCCYQRTETGGHHYKLPARMTSTLRRSFCFTDSPLGQLGTFHKRNFAIVTNAAIHTVQ